jgi:hypothetical protein
MTYGLITVADYSKLPPVPPIDTCFILDPLVATGGTACAALAMIIDWGVPSKSVALHDSEALLIVYQYQRSGYWLYSDQKKDLIMYTMNILS